MNFSTSRTQRQHTILIDVTSATSTEGAILFVQLLITHRHRYRPNADWLVPAATRVISSLFLCISHHDIPETISPMKRQGPYICGDTRVKSEETVVYDNCYYRMIPPTDRCRETARGNGYYSSSAVHIEPSAADNQQSFKYKGRKQPWAHRIKSTVLSTHHAQRC